MWVVLMELNFVALNVMLSLGHNHFGYFFFLILLHLDKYLFNLVIRKKKSIHKLNHHDYKATWKRIHEHSLIVDNDNHVTILSSYFLSGWHTLIGIWLVKWILKIVTIVSCTQNNQTRGFRWMISLGHQSEHTVMPSLYLEARESCHFFHE